METRPSGSTNGSAMSAVNDAVQSKKAVTAYLTSKQLLPSCFAERSVQSKSAVTAYLTSHHLRCSGFAEPARDGLHQQDQLLIEAIKRAVRAAA